METVVPKTAFFDPIPVPTVRELRESSEFDHSVAAHASRDAVRRRFVGREAYARDVAVGLSEGGDSSHLALPRSHGSSSQLWSDRPAAAAAGRRRTTDLGRTRLRTETPVVGGRPYSDSSPEK